MQPANLTPFLFGDLIVMFSHGNTFLRCCTSIVNSAYRNRHSIVIDPLALQHAASGLAAYSNADKDNFLNQSSGRTFIQPMVSDLSAIVDDVALTGASNDNSIHRHADTGNRALVLCGIFPEYANRRAVSLDYYANMGRSAYDHVARQKRKQPNVYYELANKFCTITDIMRDFRDSASPRHNESVLVLLQQARELGTPGTANRLEQVAPNVVDMTQWRQKRSP
jgi:hypothetical protein